MSSFGVTSNNGYPKSGDGEAGTLRTSGNRKVDFRTYNYDGYKLRKGGG